MVSLHKTLVANGTRINPRWNYWDRLRYGQETCPIASPVLHASTFECGHCEERFTVEYYADHVKRCLERDLRRAFYKGVQFRPPRTA